MMRWGFPPPRNLKSPYWRGWLEAEWRCLIPATSFCEWTDRRPKVTHWFAVDESRPLFAFAGIWRLWTGDGYSSGNLSALVRSNPAQEASQSKTIRNTFPYRSKENLINSAHYD
ncbi:MAG: SOS response-associated peptidase family protein [Gammaproteobacteria bacterium]